MAIVALLTINAGTLIGQAKRFGKKQFYTQILQPGSTNGPDIWGFTYDQPAFDHHGEERRLTFLADKSLRLQAYLRLHVSADHHVTAREEVSSHAVPTMALEQLTPRQDKQTGC